jgi:threonine dehydratase
MSLDFAAVRAAHERILPYIHRTPVLTSTRLNEASDASVFFKCENFQKVGAFKARGATNAVLSLDEAIAQRGVATHSSGNHAAALARAAKLRGITAHIVMPSNSTRAKIRAVNDYGGRIVFCEPTQAAREAACSRVIQETGATLIHPSDDQNVMAGQGTAAVEFLEDAPNLDLLLCPVGGGGLLCGAALAAKAIRSEIRVIATEPANADDTAQSVRAGHLVRLKKVDTLADGLRTQISESNFALIQQYVDEVVTVSEAAIVTAMRTIWETLKIIVEPSAAVGYAAILENRISIGDRRVGIILTGGNVDLDTLPWVKSS